MDKSKKLSKAELYYYIIGNTIGSGLFVCLPLGIAYAGKGATVAIIIAAFMVFCAVAYNTIIASLFPLKGGDYSQVSFVAPPIISGVYGVYWVVGAISIASFSVTAIHYLCTLIPVLAPYSKLIVILITTIFFAINIVGTKGTAKFEGAMTIVLLVSLLIYVVVGLTKMDIGNFISSGGFMDYGMTGILGAVGMVIWAVQGPSAAAVGFSSEIENPTREVPKAIVGGTIICTILTLLVCVVTVGVTPVEEVIAAGDITVSAASVFPRWAYLIFVIGAAIMALLTSLMGNIAMYRYPFLQLANEGWLPPVFKKTTKNGFPYMVMLLIYVLAIFPIIFNVSMDTIIAYCTMPAYIIYVFADVLCLTLPKKYPEAWKRSYLSKIPLPIYYAFCVAAFGCSIFLCYCYCMGMGWRDALAIFAFTGLMFAYAFFCIKTKRVKPEFLEEQKKAIMEEIAEYELMN